MAWCAIAVGFGGVIGNVVDPRAAIHTVNALVLAAFSARTLARSARRLETATPARAQNR